MPTLEVTGLTKTGFTISPEHFGSNFIAVNEGSSTPLVTEQSATGIPRETFLEAITALDVTDLRYPAGAPDAAYEDGLLIGGQLPEHLTNFMNAMVAEGRKVIIVTPTFGSYTGPEELQEFLELLLENYGSQVKAFEIGNEYWQAQGEFAYGYIANESIQAISAAEQATGLIVETWVQMANVTGAATDFPKIEGGLGFQARTVEANKAIISQLSEPALAAIDGVVEHAYYRPDTQIIGSLEDTTNFLWLDIQTWEQETGRTFDLAITEWNVRLANADQHGLKSASILVNHFENLIRLGADFLSFWAAQHNSKSDLAGSGQVLFDDDTGVVNNSVGGSIFDLMSSHLVGKELVDLTVAGNDPHINIHAYQNDEELIVYIASRSHDRENLHFSLAEHLPGAHLQEALLISYDTSLESSDGVHWMSSSEGFIASDYILIDHERHYVNEHDARGSVEVLSVPTNAGSASYGFDLKPYEVVQLTFSLNGSENVRATNGDDRLEFGPGDDFIDLFGGNDTVDTGQGQDTVFGGNGDDHVIAGPGDDFVGGGSGDDFLSGWGGNDTINGGAHDDILYGFQGADALNGNSGNDYLRGDSGDDDLIGETGFDTLNGGPGNDTLYGGDHADHLIGESGQDSLYGENGFDQLDGGEGDDWIDGGAGADLLIGGLGNDFIQDLSGDNRVFGGAGFDTIIGGDGADSLNGENQADKLYGGDGNDSLTGGQGFDLLSGGAGNDHLDGGIHNDRLIGELGNDTLYGQAGFDFLEGGDGNDLLDGGNEADRITGGSGHDFLIGGNGVDYLFGGNQADTLEGGDGADTVIGGHGNDFIYGDVDGDRLLGGTGNDGISGGAGNDTIFAGAGFDTIEGGSGDDLLYGNFNADLFLFAGDHGHDTIADLELGNSSEKIDIASFSGNGTITSWVEQIGTDVRISTNNNSSITVQGADVQTLIDCHFIM